jgi:hypothetical protein
MEIKNMYLLQIGTYPGGPFPSAGKVQCFELGHFKACLNQNLFRL